MQLLPSYSSFYKCCRHIPMRWCKTTQISKYQNHWKRKKHFSSKYWQSKSRYSVNLGAVSYSKSSYQVNRWYGLTTCEVGAVSSSMVPNPLYTAVSGSAWGETLFVCNLATQLREITMSIAQAMHMVCPPITDTSRSCAMLRRTRWRHTSNWAHYLPPAHLHVMTQNKTIWTYCCWPSPRNSTDTHMRLWRLNLASHMNNCTYISRNECERVSVCVW
jgi:hypothetical protein